MRDPIGSDWPPLGWGACYRPAYRPAVVLLLVDLTLDIASNFGRHRVGCGNLTDAVDAMLAGEDAENIVVLAANPSTVDAIIRRWQALTGGSARHLANGGGFAEPASEVSDAG